MSGKRSSIPILVYQYLKEHSDEDHLCSMPEMSAYCEENGAATDRRGIYHAISELNEHGAGIAHVHKGSTQGYYIKHPFTLTEAFILLSAVNESAYLSEAASKDMDGKIRSLLSTHQSDYLPQGYNRYKSDNEQVLQHITILLKAVTEKRYISFQYYDITVNGVRRYRRNGEPYQLVPFAIVSDNNRYYAVCYSSKYKDFANYRIDKMDHIVLMNQRIDDIVFFDIDDHMKESFNMYHGEKKTVTMRVKNELASQVFDQFGDDLIFTKMDDESFTVSITTAITPTLIAWIIQFSDSITILKPDELIDEIRSIANHILEQYK